MPARMLDRRIKQGRAQPLMPVFLSYREAGGRPDVRCVDWFTAALPHNTRTRKPLLRCPRPDPHPSGGRLVDICQHARRKRTRQLVAKRIGSFRNSSRAPLGRRHHRPRALAAAPIATAAQHRLHVIPASAHRGLRRYCRHITSIWASNDSCAGSRAQGCGSAAISRPAYGLTGVAR